MKWLTIIILIGMVVALSSNQKQGQKEASYSFRCSEDKTAVEMFAKESGFFTAWQVCSNGECIDDNGPKCIVTQATEPAKQSTPLTSYLPLALAIGGIFYWKRRK